MIQINNLSKSFGTQELLDECSLIVGRNERIGFVGRNGSGKSTLFKMILGEMTYDSGEIQVPARYKIGTLEQHIHFEKATVLDECTQALSEEEKYDVYKAEKILSGLGFEENDFKRSPLEFSGGYQIRINLAKALLSNPNLLLLDEPTNYLDIVSLRWLEKFLKSFDGELILITHDREFMDSVATHVMGITRKKIKKIEGNTEKFYEQIAQEEELYEQMRINQENKKKELQQFVDKFKAKASKATQAQSKMKQIEKIGSLEKLSAERSMGLKFQYEKCPSKNLMEINSVSFSYTGKDDDFLFKDISLNIGREDRIGIIGKNGKGKSTLLNVIGNELTPIRGQVSTHPLILKGHFGQTNIQRLDLTRTILEEVSSSNPSLGNTQVRKICGSMMFTGDLAEKKISVLSGGERARVLLGKILAHKTNILLLDEPTNHLDMESVEILATELNEYEGALILVTHNEMLLRKLVNRLIVFQKGGAEVFEGNYDEFLEKIGWEEEKQEIVSKVTAAPRLSKQERAERVLQRSREIKPVKQSIEKSEAAITAAENKIEELNRKLVVASESGASSDIVDLSKEISQLEQVIEDEFDNLEEMSILLAELEKKWECYLLN